MRAADDFDAIRRRIDEIKGVSPPPQKSDSLAYTPKEARDVAKRFNCRQSSCAWRISHCCEIAGKCQHSSNRQATIVIKNFPGGDGSYEEIE